MKLLQFVILILTFVSCVRKESSDRLLTQHLTYSAFLWHLSPDNDSFNFYLAHYIDIDKNGHFKLMRRDSFMSKPKFFEGTVSNKLQKLIDTTFEKDTLKTDYNWNVHDGFVYDGLIYCFLIKKKDSTNQKRIFFIPNKSPIIIDHLALELDTLIYRTKEIVIDTVDTYLYQEELKRYYVDQYGKLPMINKEQKKFKPVKIRR